MNRRTALYFTSLAAAGALAVGACSAPVEGTTAPVPTETMVVDPLPPTTFPTAPETTTAAAPTPLGGTYTYDDGLAVTVVDAGEGTDTYTAERYRKLTFSITNGTAEVFDPVIVSTTVHYGANGIGAPSHINIAEMPNPYFSGVILPGGTQTITAGYDAPAGEPLVVSVTPSWDHGPAVFTG